MEEKPTRREFLKKVRQAATALIGATTGATAAASMIFDSNRLRVETEDGNFDLLLSAHGNLGINPTKVGASDFQRKTDAIVLEGFGSENEIFVPEQKRKEEPGDSTPRYDLGAIIYAAENGIPFYFCDPTGAREALHFYALAYSIPITEGAVIFGAEKAAKKAFPRRELLIGGATWSALAFGPGNYVIPVFLSSVLSQPWAETARKLWGEAELRTPFDFAMAFRNAEVSYKALEIAKRLKEGKGRKPEITIVYGKHLNMETWLEKGQGVCRDYMEQYPTVILETIFGLDKQKCAERIASTLEVRMRKNGGNLEPIIILHQDPELYKAMGGEEDVIREREIKIAALREPEREAAFAFTRGKERF